MAATTSGKYRANGRWFRLRRSTRCPSRKARHRKPSHLGSNIHPSPSGRSRARRASIGASVGEDALALDAEGASRDGMAKAHADANVNSGRVVTDRTLRTFRQSRGGTNGLRTRRNGRVPQWPRFMLNIESHDPTGNNGEGPPSARQECRQVFPIHGFGGHDSGLVVTPRESSSAPVEQTVI